MALHVEHRHTQARGQCPPLWLPPQELHCVPQHWSCVPLGRLSTILPALWDFPTLCQSWASLAFSALGFCFSIPSTALLWQRSSVGRGDVPSSRWHLSPQSPHSAGSTGPRASQNPQNSPLRTPKGVHFARGIRHLARLAVILVKAFPAHHAESFGKSSSQRFECLWPCCSNPPVSGEVLWY